MGSHLNCGSGQRPFGPPFINVDINPRWNPDVVADISSMPMFDDGSADVIVIHHCLEHFQCGEGIGMLKECYRILGKGGSLIVTVPNIRALVKAWITNRLTTQIFMTSIYGAYMGDDADTHKWGFVPETLMEQIAAAGRWTDLRPFDYRPIAGADIARDFWILGAEAVK